MSRPFQQHTSEEMHTTLQACSQSISALTPANDVFETEQDANEFWAAIGTSIDISIEKFARGETTPAQELALHAFLKRFRLL